MIPKSLSASAIQILDACPARFVAEYGLRARGISSTAGDLGTSVHGALELYVKLVYIDKVQDESVKFLLELFKMSYIQTFGSADTDTQDYADGVDMLERWFARSVAYFEKVDVLSVEVKLNFNLKTSIGDIPFNYIFDRCDRIKEDGSLRVVDYKSWRKYVRSDDLSSKIQMRSYGLAAAIQFKEMAPPRIWIGLDQLRHDGWVGFAVTREDNKVTYARLHEWAERAISIDEDNPEEKLNPECNWCVRKLDCKTLRSNVAAGGIMSLPDNAARADARAQLDYQISALLQLKSDLDRLIMSEAEETEVYEWQGTDNTLYIGSGRSNREIDSFMAKRVIGDEIWNKTVTGKITMKQLDDLLKGNELTDEKKAQLKGLITKPPGGAKVMVKSNDPFLA